MAELVINGVNTFRRSRILEALEIDGVLYTDSIEERTPGSGVSIASHTKPSTDNSIDLGDPALRWRNIRFGTAIEGYKASGDTYPTIQLSAQSSLISFGAGGASATDVDLFRSTAEVLGVKRYLRISRRGTNPSGFELYDVELQPNTSLPTDYGRLRIYDNVANWRFAIESAGTGALKDLIFIMGGVESFRIKTDADIQIDAARKLWFGTDVNLYRYYTNILKTDNYLFAYIIATNGGFFPRVTLSNDGRALVEAAPADSVNTLRDSPAFVARARYWDGTQSISRDAAIFHRMTSTAPSSELVLQIAGTDIAVFKDNKQLLIDSIAELTAGAGVTFGSDISIGANKIKTTNLEISEESPNKLYVRKIGSTSYVQFTNLEIYSSKYLGIDNLYDVGSATQRARSIYFGTSLVGYPNLANSTNTLVSSPELRLVSSVWDSAAASAKTQAFKLIHNPTALDRGELSISFIKTDGTEYNSKIIIRQTAYDETQIHFISPYTSGFFIAALAPTDTYARILVRNNGTIEWGDGANPPDVKLYRGGANILKTDNSFQAYHISSNFGDRPRAVLHNLGDVNIVGRTADSVNTLINSPYLRFYGAYWNGTSSVDYTATIHLGMVDTAPTAELVFNMGGTLVMRLRSNGTLYVSSIAELSTGAGVTLVNGAILPNNVALMAKDIQANVREIIKIDSANFLVLGDLSRDIKLNALANIILPDGVKIAWSDVNLYRGAANILKTDDWLYVYAFKTNGGIRPNFTARENGLINVISSLADSVNTLVNSPPIQLTGTYWNGTASVDRIASIFHRMLSTTPTSEIVLQINGADYFRVGDSGIVAHRDVLPGAAGINIGSPTSLFKSLFLSGDWDGTYGSIYMQSNRPTIVFNATNVANSKFLIHAGDANIDAISFYSRNASDTSWELMVRLYAIKAGREAQYNMHIVPYYDNSWDIGFINRRWKSIRFGISVEGFADAADSTNTIRDSPYLSLVASYWNGTQSVNRYSYIIHRMISTAPSSELVFQIAGVDYLRVGDNGIIAHKVVLPYADNTIDIGQPTLRIRNIYVNNVYASGVVQAGDVLFANGWRFTEDERYGIVLVSPDGRRYRLRLEKVN